MMKRTIAMLLMAINTIVLNSMYSSYSCQVNAEKPTFSADRTKVIIKIEFIFYTVDLNNIFGTVKKTTIYDAYYKSANSLL